MYEREAHWPFWGERHKAVITGLTDSQPDIKVISSLDIFQQLLSKSGGGGDG